MAPHRPPPALTCPPIVQLVQPLPHWVAVGDTAAVHQRQRLAAPRQECARHGAPERASACTTVGGVLIVAGWLGGKRGQ
eukprot:151109-Chlamydomonas_euryale.AAC.1